MKKMFLKTLFISLIVVVSSEYAEARIKMVALPERETTFMRMDHQPFTLIEEERILTLQEGVNQVDFSWNGVDIDPDSIRLAILEHPEEVRLLNVSFPPNEAALVWEISSNQARQERVRVTYLMSNVDALTAYKATVTKDETKMDLRGDTIVRNFSGEDFNQTKLFIGTEEVKLFDVGHEETKQLQLFYKEDLPVKKIWRWDSGQQAWDPGRLQTNVGIPVYYHFVNNKDYKLGKDILNLGKIRVYQQDGQGGTIFSGEDHIETTPKNKEFEVYIGDSRDVVVTQRKMVDQKQNVIRNDSNRVVMYDLKQVINAKIENFKDEPVTLEMIQRFPSEWEMTQSNMNYEVKDHQTIVYKIDLPPKGNKDLNMSYLLRHIRQ